MKIDIGCCFLLFVFIDSVLTRSVGEDNDGNDEDIIRKTAFITNIDTGSNIVSSHRKSSNQTNANENAETRSTINSRSSKSSSEKRVCRTEQCYAVADKIRGSMDTSISPCHDFYDFACGSWINNRKIPSCENEITSFTVLTKTIENQIKELIEKDNKPGESEALVKARDFYASCTDTKEIKRLGAKPALDFIDHIGGWSLCNNDKWKNGQEEKWNATDILKRIQKEFYPAPPFLSFEVTNDHLNSTRHLIKVLLYAVFSNWIIKCFRFPVGKIAENESIGVYF